MTTMTTGRKTLLALAVSSVMAGNVLAVESHELEELQPIDIKENTTIGSNQFIDNKEGSAITSNVTSGYSVTNNGTLKGSQHAIHVLANKKLAGVTNNGKIEAVNGAAIMVESGGAISHINNLGEIIGGYVEDENGISRRVAVDIRGAISDHQDALKIGSSSGEGGTIVGNIYMNSKAGEKNVFVKGDGTVLNSYVAFYGSESDKAIFDGTLIANVSEVFVSGKSYMLLKAQNESIVFDVVDYGVDLDNQNNGKFDIKSSSTLEMEINGSLGKDEAVLAVNGDVIFGGDNELIVTGDINEVAGEHTLITADKITGFDESMVKGTWLTNVEVIADGTDDTITVEITYKEDFDPNELLGDAAAHGADATEQAVLGAFAGIIASSENIEVTEDTITFTGTNSAVLEELTNLLSAGGADAAQLAGELTPDRSGAKLHAAQRAQNKQLDAISNRMNSLRADQYHAVSASNSGLWMQVYGNDAKKDVSGRIDGYDVKGMGFSIGVDGELGENLITGMAFSQNYQDIDTITYDTNYEVNTYQLSAYGLWNQDNYFVTGTVNGGINYYDSYRTIGEGQPGISDPRAAAEFSAFHFGARVTAGMDLAFDNILVQPIIAAELNRVEVESYDESGSVGSLAYDKQTISQAKLGAGVNASTTFELGNGILTPSLSAMGWYDFKADNQDISGSIVMDPSVEGTITTASGSSETRFEMRAGLDYSSNGALTFGLGLQHAVEDDTRDSQVQLRMNYAY